MTLKKYYFTTTTSIIIIGVVYCMGLALMLWWHLLGYHVSVSTTTTTPCFTRCYAVKTFTMIYSIVWVKQFYTKKYWVNFKLPTVILNQNFKILSKFKSLD